MDDTVARPRRTKFGQLSAPEWNALLAALDTDPARAAEKYEIARSGLIRIFRARGLWNEAEDLADHTLDRSARRLLEKACTTDPILNILSYLQAVARKVAAEARRQPRHFSLEEAAEPAIFPNVREDTNPEMYERALDCLRKLLRELPARERTIIIEYYRYAKSVKIAHRATFALISDRSRGALRVKAYRIRRFLGKQLLKLLSASEACTESRRAGARGAL